MEASHKHNIVTKKCTVEDKRRQSEGKSGLTAGSASRFLPSDGQTDGQTDGAPTPPTHRYRRVRHSWQEQLTLTAGAEYSGASRGPVAVWSLWPARCPGSPSRAQSARSALLSPNKHDDQETAAYSNRPAFFPPPRSTSFFFLSAAVYVVTLPPYNGEINNDNGAIDKQRWRAACGAYNRAYVRSGGSPPDSKCVNSRSYSGPPRLTTEPSRVPLSHHDTIEPLTHVFYQGRSASQPRRPLPFRTLQAAQPEEESLSSRGSYSPQPDVNKRVVGGWGGCHNGVQEQAYRGAGGGGRPRDSGVFGGKPWSGETGFVLPSRRPGHEEVPACCAPPFADTHKSGELISGGPKRAPSPPPPRKGSDRAEEPSAGAGEEAHTKHVISVCAWAKRREGETGERGLAERGSWSPSDGRLTHLRARRCRTGRSGRGAAAAGFGSWCRRGDLLWAGQRVSGAQELPSSLLFTTSLPGEPNFC
ncbi:hypothetical protein SKAU_G00112690 [Synaphobranchus kaupii]|uniref:Uncharacterized protein n=1 Tax=Synaphobranchus kaupii TaxID=118154 RepID=A0A9Q1G1W8_SYNKA|nr:hypothetical protein SKAU_G00112690 [Synaphobranchus kaupii]